MQNCSIVFPLVAPFDDLPAPTGPYQVGTRTTTWADSTRDETFTEEVDQRRIVVQVWYPLAEEVQGSPALYIDSPELRLPAIAKQLRLPVTLFKHFEKVSTHSYVDHSRGSRKAQAPVILFSHGLSGMRFQNTALMEELASYGYVVFSADHSYEANITIFDNGETAEYEAGEHSVFQAHKIEDLDLSQLGIVVDDLRFILDQISMDNSDPFLSDLNLDLDRIGAAGHSLGGAAILSAMDRDDRIDAAMLLDGWYHPVPDSVVSGGVKGPFFHLGQKAWSERDNYQRMDRMLSNSSGPIFKLLIPGTSHTDFTDMPLFTRFSLYIGYTQVRDPVWLNDLIRKSALSFFDVHLRGAETKTFTDLLQAETAASSYIFIPTKHK